MAAIVPHHGFQPDGLGSSRKVHLQGDCLANSHALNPPEAEAAFRDAIGVRAQGGYLLLSYHADHKRYFGLEPGKYAAIRSA
jgi:hypothetical protein